MGAYIAGLSKLERVGIAWTGENDTFLHAFHNGARVDDAGHVWRFNPRTFAASRMDGGGYLTVLGDPTLPNAQLAQVFTMPQTAKERVQVVSLHIETLRADRLCGSDMAVDVAQYRGENGAANSTVSLMLPACDAALSSLVLKNVLKDMKVARK